MSADLANVTVTTRFSGHAGTTMTIYCTATGPLTSTLTWTKDHLTLQPSNRIKYDVNGTCSALTIRMTKKADSGNYTCNVRWPITNKYNKYLNKLIGICSGAFHCLLNCIGSCEESPELFHLLFVFYVAAIPGHIFRKQYLYEYLHLPQYKSDLS